MYNESLVMKEIAKGIGEYVSGVSDQLSYSRGYVGTVCSKNGDDYYVKINGDRHKLKTDYPLIIGETVNVISQQNQNADFVLVPSAKHVQRLINTKGATGYSITVSNDILYFTPIEPDPT